MKIYDVRINGIVNPVGFLYDSLICSWKVAAKEAKEQTQAMIEVSTEPGFTDILYRKEGRGLKSVGELLEIRLEPCMRYYVRITVTGDDKVTAVCDTAYFETAKLTEVWRGKWIGMQPQDAFHPEFRRRFTLREGVESARLYITGVGLFEAYINGNKAGDDLLAPFISDYQTAVQYMTYDVTDRLQVENEITVILGNGWYKGRLSTDQKEVFGDRFEMIAELKVTYSDGQTDVIAADERWEYRGSLIEESDLYDGEIYNECLWAGQENSWKPVVVIDNSRNKLCERYSLPVIAKEERKAVEIIRTPGGELVLDTGQNLAGYVEFKSALPAGCRVTFDFGEVLQKDCFYRDNYRSAKAQFVYVSDGIQKTIRPHFTYFGFRYVRISGWIGEVHPDDFTVKVIYSDLKRSGWFETSDEKINRLYENTLWGLKSNFLDLPTDCPQRDERLGWTGDAQVFAPTASYHMDTKAFFDKYLRDLRYDQLRNDGRIAFYLPNLQPGASSSVWGDAATFIPEVLYDYYGDNESLRKHYPLMKDWIGYIDREDEKRGRKYLFDFGFHFGDWLALDGVTEQSVHGGTDSRFIASVYYYASVSKTARAAGILKFEQEEKEFQELAGKIKQAIFDEYFSPNGRLTIDTQTAYLISLKYDIFIDKQKITEGLKGRLKKDCYRIRGGFIGATMMCTVLADHGMEDLAYDFLFYEGFPGWLRCVNLGATTVWERWNSILDDGSISGTEMNSLNHYAYGSVMEFAYKHMVGIQALGPGFTRALIAPKPTGRLGFAHGRYESAAGTYVSEWQILADGRLKVHVEIPFSANAELRLPYSGKEDISLTAGSYDFQYLPVRDLRRQFTEESRLEEILEHEEARAIFVRLNPEMAKRLDEWTKEEFAMTLGELKFMPFLGAKPNEVEQTMDEIFGLKRK